MLAKAELLVSLYEQEDLWVTIEVAYRVAALSYTKAKKPWEAVKWTMKATEAWVLSDGSRDALMEDLELVAN